MGEDVEGAVFGEFREDYGIYGGKMGCGWVGGEKVCVCVGVGGGEGGGSGGNMLWVSTWVSQWCSGYGVRLGR